MATIMLKGFLGSGVLIYLEQKFLTELFPALYKTGAFGLPKAYAAVLLFNVLGSMFRLLGLGMAVGGARKKYDVPLPKMQAEGDSEEAKKFNCVQRGHQQALETYPQFLAMSLASGLVAPVGTAAMGLVWSVARKAWADGYATGNPDSRYSSAASMGIWYTLLYVMTGTAGMAVKLAADI